MYESGKLSKVCLWRVLVIIWSESGISSLLWSSSRLVAYCLFKFMLVNQFLSQAFLRHKGESVSGKKGDLVERAAKWLDEHPQ